MKLPSTLPIDCAHPLSATLTRLGALGRARATVGVLGLDIGSNLLITTGRFGRSAGLTCGIGGRSSGLRGLLKTVVASHVLMRHRGASQIRAHDWGTRMVHRRVAGIVSTHDTRGTLRSGGKVGIRRHVSRHGVRAGSGRATSLGRRVISLTSKRGRGDTVIIRASAVRATERSLRAHEAGALFITARLALNTDLAAAHSAVVLQKFCVSAVGQFEEDVWTLTILSMARSARSGRANSTKAKELIRLPATVTDVSYYARARHGERISANWNGTLVEPH